MFFLYPYGFGKSGIAGSISINGETGRIEINGIEIDEMESVNINVSANTGCVEGSGVAKTEKREVASFSKIDVDGVFDVYIECQQKKSVEITTDDNILPHISTKVKGSTLFITSNRSICPKSQLDVNISIENIESITSTGTNDISIFRVNNEELVMDLNGTGDVKASGKTNKFIPNISGSGELYAKDLQSEDVRISISGASEATVHATKSLHVDISGVGDICYYGNPAKVTKEISGVGEIIKK